MRDMSARPVAAIDCGTNTIRLLIAEEGSQPTEVVRELELVRLGQGVDATGEFHADALQRTFAACDRYAELIAEHHAEHVRFIATSAARDAGNRAEFFAGVQQRLGVVPEVISGNEEARLSFTGATSGVAATGRVVVFDIGGGSTELVVGSAAGEIDSACSLNVGSVRITERFFAHRPPTGVEVEEATAFVDGLLTSSGVDLSQIDTAIGVAGTVTSVSAALQGLVNYDRQLVHRSVINAQAVAELTADWLVRPTNELIDAYHLHPLRAEVLAAGALILSEIAGRLPVPIIVSETDILDGIVQEMLASQRLS